MIAGLQSSRILGVFGAPLDGMRQSQRKLEEHSGRIARGDLSVENVVGLMEAEGLYKANAAAARTAGQMIGTILDTFV